MQHHRHRLPRRLDIALRCRHGNALMQAEHQFCGTMGVGERVMDPAY